MFLSGKRALVTGSTSGIGLAIARSLTELHGGSLRLRSAMGAGTIVMVHLPLDGGAHRVTAQAA